MSKSTFTKKQMSTILADLAESLKQQTHAFPGIKDAVIALSLAALNPQGKTQPAGPAILASIATKVVPIASHSENDLANVVAKLTAEVKPKASSVVPVSISYYKQDLLIKTPWGQAGKALKIAFNAMVGKMSKDGQHFLSCFDKTHKAFRVPKDKLSDVVAAIEEQGLPVKMT